MFNIFPCQSVVVAAASAGCCCWCCSTRTSPHSPSPVAADITILCNLQYWQNLKETTTRRHTTMTEHKFTIRFSSFYIIPMVAATVCYSASCCHEQMFDLHFSKRRGVLCCVCRRINERTTVVFANFLSRLNLELTQGTPRTATTSTTAITIYRRKACDSQLVY